MGLQASATRLFEDEPSLMDSHLLQPTIMTYASSRALRLQLPFQSTESKEKVYYFESQSYTLRTMPSTGERVLLVKTLQSKHAV